MFSTVLFRIISRFASHSRYSWIFNEFLALKLQRLIIFISRFIDDYDWQIIRFLFVQFERLLYPHTVDDCFANHYNFKISWFFLKFWTLGCTGIDLFIQSLSIKNCLVFLPACLVSKTFHYMFEQEEVGSILMVVPFWPSSSFWLLFSRTFIYIFFVEFIKVISGDGISEHGLSVNALLGSKPHNGSVLSARFKLTRSEVCWFRAVSLIGSVITSKYQ